MLKLWRKRWFRKQWQFKRSMRGSRMHAILGRHAFHPKVWRSDKRSIAGGLAVGLFTAFLPIPIFQMLLAAGGARCNSPNSRKAIETFRQYQLGSPCRCLPKSCNSPYSRKAIESKKPSRIERAFCVAMK